MADDHSGVQTLAKNDMMGVRMDGLILMALVQRNFLTGWEAAELIRDVVKNAPDGSNLAPAYEALAREIYG